MASLMGVASRQRLTAMLPSQQFHCLLDELPLHLIPPHGLDLSHTCDEFGSLQFSPQCAILPAGKIPAELVGRRDLLEGFCLESSMAWVHDPPTAFLHPFWLGPELEVVLRQLRAGKTDPASLPDHLLRVLRVARILIPAGEAERRITEWDRMVQRGAKLFRERNYAPLSELIHPFHIAALRRYYRYAIRTGTIRLGDEQSSRRYVAHNHPVARYFHHQIAGAVSAIVGEPVKPSYVYLASYLSGAELMKHTDREQCEFSVTLCLDFSPEAELATPWPIRLDTAEGTVTVYQALGDGLVYRGTQLAHYRDVLAEGQTSTSMFFHYVPAEFSGPLD
jgi:hypothetical protein